MPRSKLAQAELLVGTSFFLIAGILLADSQLCVLNKQSCGMVEPLEAVAALALGISPLLAGFLRGHSWRLALLAYIPAALAAMAIGYQSLY